MPEAGEPVLRRVWGVGVVCALALVTGTAGASPARIRGYDPEWIAAGRSIAYRVAPTDALWVMRADGTGRRAVHASAANGVEPALSPDGRTVAVAVLSDEGVSLVLKTLKGKVRRRLRWRGRFDGVDAPVWAPGGRSVAIQTGIDAGQEVLLADLRTGLRRVSREPGRDEQSPAWSPDGNRVAFFSCERKPRPPTYEIFCGLSASNARGGPRRVIRPNLRVSVLDAPAWAPNGRSIAFSARIGRETYPGGGDDPVWRYAIYVVRPDGSGLRRVADTPATDAMRGLAWSADSRRLAFDHNQGIFVVTVATRRQRRVTTTGGGGHLSWAPSDRLLFADDGIYTVVPGRQPVLVGG